MNLSDSIKILMTNCLYAKEHDSPLIIFDDHGRSIVEELINTFKNYFTKGIAAYYIPIEYQLYISKTLILPDVLIKNINLASILLTATTDFDDCTGFRRLVIEYATGNNLKIIHMPGVDEEIFCKSINNINFKEIHELALPIYNSMSVSSVIKITTKSFTGKVYSLKASIRNRHPHMCGGLAQPGEIMNFPTGEVYIAPNEENTHGFIVLNGTTGSEVLLHPEEIILSVESGRVNLTKSAFPNTPRAKRFKYDLELIERSDPLYLTVCEIGIGINSTIKELTGNEIWDEKSLGTAHIALGANSIFGGTIIGNYHKDLVFYPSNIMIGRKNLEIKWSTRPNK